MKGDQKSMGKNSNIFSRYDEKKCSLKNENITIKKLASNYEILRDILM